MKLGSPVVESPELFRVYGADELGADGYSPEWHATIKHAVRAAAGNRCVRCLHPYIAGANPLEVELDDAGREVYVSWSPCDDECSHGGPIRCRELYRGDGVTWQEYSEAEAPDVDLFDYDAEGRRVQRWECEARWRVLTVHHLDNVKANCRWWNLVSLCQRCHLTIQRRVVMARVWPWEHTAWFRPYVAGYYASVYLGEELPRDAVVARLDELLALERMA